MPFISRRRFFWMALGGCSSLALGASLWRWHGGVEGKEEIPPLAEATGLQPIQHTTRALGSEVHITALHAQAEVAHRAVAQAVEELQLVEELMSLYRPDSEIVRLNRHKTLEQPHPYLVEVLLQAQAMARRSRGAFDVTVQPLWQAHDEARQSGELPTASVLQAALRKVGWQGLEVSPRRVRLNSQGGAVTLNGIAQGFAADRVLAALRQHGVAHALVNTGEIATLGRRADAQEWSVGIQQPRCPEAYLGVVKLGGRCLATSGDYATSFSADFNRNHIFDPRVGQSPQHFSSVSVAAPTATLADALSTAVFVLGPEQGLRLVRSIPGADSLLVFKNGRTVATRGFPELV